MPRKKQNDICSVDGCDERVRARGWCHLHYHRWWQFGDPLSDKPRQLYGGDPAVRFWTKVDKLGPIPERCPELGSCWVWRGTAHKPSGYALFHIDGRMIYAHRFSWELANGSISDEYRIDHRCHNTSCVNPRHLRPASNKQNGEHRRGPPRNNTSGVRGVFWNKRYGCWTAQIWHNGKNIRLGHFITLEEAKAAREVAENLYFTHHASTKEGA